MSAAATPLEALLRRDRLLILGGVLGASAIAWVWLVVASRDMYGEMSGAAAWMMVDAWDLRYFLLIFAMWAAMMLGMMLPTAAPTLLLFGMSTRSGASTGSASTGTVSRVYAFAAGYLLVWSAFSLGATTLQWALSRAALLTPMMESASARLGAVLLIVAGAYQWTPLKQSCLSQCRAPVSFLMQSWKPGMSGALRMGLEHGLDCLGCCWVLMLLLFVGGVMNLTWIAAITIFVLIEKLAPLGVQGGRLSGLFLVVAGAWTLIVRS